MDFYIAPMEGITGYVYRNAYHKYFHNAEKYFTPFITPHTKRSLNAREKNDILPEHNEGLRVVPQILTNQAEDFIKIGKILQGYGYQEINLNLGCPSPTVTAKKRGAGFLAYPRELNQFLEEVFAALDMKISIKTRIGKECPEEFAGLLEIYDEYPLEELIIHPRLQTDFYRNQPDWQVFERALEKSRNPVCYNGDIFSYEDYQAFQAAFPQEEKVMLGRGVIGNPGLIDHIVNGQELEKEKLRAFFEELRQGYQQTVSGDKNVLFRLKEVWYYTAHIFSEGERYLKKIRKCQYLTQYEIIVNALFREQEILPQKGFAPAENKK